MGSENKPLERRLIRLGDVRLRCDRNNTWIYSFKSGSEQNHIWVRPNKIKPNYGIYVHQFELEHHFPDKPNLYGYICRQLGTIGVETVCKESPSAEDTEVYYEAMAKLGLTLAGIDSSGGGQERMKYSVQQQNRFDFFRYLLENGLFEPSDFTNPDYYVVDQ